MIVIYRKSDNMFILAVPGYPETSEAGNRLLINGEVAVNDLNLAGYLKIPDQPINRPQVYDPTIDDVVYVPTPYTALGLDLNFSHDQLPASAHLAEVVAINPGAVKPAVVRRTFDFTGQSYDIPCYVSQNVKNEYLAGDIQVGDIVLIVYCEERPGEAAVLCKIFKSWP